MDENKANKIGVFIVPVAIVLAGIMVSGAIFAAQRAKQSDTEADATQEQTTDNSEFAIDGTFSYTEGGTVKTQDGKPVVRLFSTTWCGHCKWVKETFDAIVKEYVEKGEIIAYHWEIDIADNTLTEEVETKVPDEELAVYEKFNPRGSIPTFVIGEKYFRIGNGFEQSTSTDEEKLALEKEEFKRIIEQAIAEAK